jgi:hypothetical protein
LFKKVLNTNLNDKKLLFSLKSVLLNKFFGKVLQAIRNAVECTSIGGDADKNLLRNKDLAKVVRFLGWLISFKNI